MPGRTHLVISLIAAFVLAAPAHTEEQSARNESDTDTANELDNTVTNLSTDARYLLHKKNYPDHDNQPSIISQKNIATIKQQGSYNRARIRQQGTDNESSIIQKGKDNLSDIWQRGSRNTAQQQQNGYGNTAQSLQFGKNNFSRQLQNGHGLRSRIKQFGNNGRISVKQGF